MTDSNKRFPLLQRPVDFEYDPDDKPEGVLVDTDPRIAALVARGAEALEPVLNEYFAEAARRCREAAPYLNEETIHNIVTGERGLVVRVLDSIPIAALLDVADAAYRMGSAYQSDDLSEALAALPDKLRRKA